MGSCSTPTRSAPKEIREEAAYQAFCVRVTAEIGPWGNDRLGRIHRRSDGASTATGLTRPDTRQPDLASRLCTRDHSTIAEKTVTILERGIASSRWRDYVDIVQLTGHGIDPTALLRSARAVARHRGVTPEPIAPHLVGYGEVRQAKWAAWRRKEKLESVCQASLDEQINLVINILDPVFGRSQAAATRPSISARPRRCLSRTARSSKPRGFDGPIRRGHDQ